ncbi:Prefoldin subunit alpha [anaerobic digester metagenome]
MVNKVEREVQVLQHYLNEYGQQIEVLSQQLQMIEHGRAEAAAAVETLVALAASPDGTVLLPVGGGASLRVKVLDADRVLLNLGSEVVVERQNAEAREFLEDRMTEMEASSKRLAETLGKLQGQANEVAQRLDQIYRMVQQQQGQAPAARTG